MNKPALRRTSDLPAPANSGAADLDDAELRRRLASAGQSVGYDRRDSTARVEDPLKRLALDVPESVHTQVRVRAASEGRTINSLMLEILSQAGFDVSPESLVSDRRKNR